MKSLPLPALARIVMCLALNVLAMALLSAQEISSSPSSLMFQNTYVGKASGSKVLTISKVASGTVNITGISFDCAGFGIASGIAPFSLTSGQLITHYSIFFQPNAAQSYNCNFVITLKDKSTLKVPLTAKGLGTTAVSSVSPTSLTFPDQSLGKASAGQTVTIKNTGGQSMKLTAITLSPPDFTVSSIKLPATINKGASLALQVFYTPSHEVSENGAIDFTYDSVPDGGASLTGNGVASSSLAIATFPTLPQATKSSAYQATLAASGGSSPFTWEVASGSSLPGGLSLSSAGVISGTLSSSVGTGNNTFSIQVTDSESKTATTQFTLGIYANLGDNCNDISSTSPTRARRWSRSMILERELIRDRKADSIRTAATAGHIARCGWGRHRARHPAARFQRQSRRQRQRSAAGGRRVHGTERIQLLPAHRQRGPGQKSLAGPRQRGARRRDTAKLQEHYFELLGNSHE